MKRHKSTEIVLEEGNMKVVYCEGERRTQIRIQNLGDEYKGELYLSPADLQALQGMLEALALS